MISVSARQNEFHIVAFDPGGTTGWAHLVVDFRAFSRPEHSALKHVITWDCGEYPGTENEQVKQASRLIWRARFGDMPFNSRTDVVSEGMTKADILSEDFELTQRVGGNNLLSPVRINAKLDWVCSEWGLALNLQKRSMRTGVTGERLTQFGFISPMSRTGRWTTTGRGKDAFSAMQHAIVWLRRMKESSKSKPWKLSGRGQANDKWDCACESGGRCDIRHLRR